MQDKTNKQFYRRIRNLKTALLALSLTILGVTLIGFGVWLNTASGASLPPWLGVVPFGELGGILVGAGLLGSLFESTFRRDQQEATTEQFRQIIREEAPALRDAVVDGFAVNPEDLKRVANPALLDSIASNALGLRLGDETFAGELYGQIRDQAIAARERWVDASVDVKLSTAVERSTNGTPLLDVVLEAEYTTTPAFLARQFACAGTEDDLASLVGNPDSAMTWKMRPGHGLDPSSVRHFELVEFTVDGEQCPIQRVARRKGQVFTVQLPDGADERSARIRYVIKLATAASGHRFFVRLPQPTKDMSLSVDYSDAGFAAFEVDRLVPTYRPMRVHRMPESVGSESIKVDVPGWLLPNTGVTFTWTLSTELPQSVHSEAA